MAKERLTTEEIKNEILLRTDHEGSNLWHIASFSGDVDVMQRLWGFAKERLTTEEIKTIMFLRTENEGRNACHIAANRSKLDAMQKIWELAKERLATEEININSCYAKSMSE